ncbi:hypothetical protein JOD64_000390 [Micromonospora luteifusca]|uniref:PASTA domain-containing protein n=1 Tax=Micromonospora luteifusca TaxID=709860 RepID=A0ABS2LLW4_9ACTN|nr:hypothetical protein [Micromonospora luteifusca]MBM7489168.1 hypothetical protein [Micromonospora luteifusca]
MVTTRRRWVFGGVALLVVALLGAGLWRHFDSPESKTHDSAVDDAAKKVDQVLFEFEYDHLFQAEKYVHSASQHPDIAVLAVSGETHWQTGVTMVLRVMGHGVEIGADGSVIDERDEPICFRLQLGPHDDRRDDDIECPADDPLQVVQDPSLSGVDERVKSALQAVGPDESAVRAAIADLGLDPAIVQEVTAQGGRVGVALRAAQYDCILARVTTKGAELWRPSHTQLAPGELRCAAPTALGSNFGKSPH